MPKPKPTKGRPEYTRQLPADSLLQASEAALTAENFDELRLNALKLAPTPAAPSELHRMWIRCPSVIKKKHLCNVLDELGMDDQPQIWKAARDARLIQDFKLIPNLGICFTCTSYDTASKLSLVKLNAFGTQIQIARFSQFNSRYYVDLVRLPDEVTDRMIFDWFEQRGAPPTCILPTYVRNGLPSRERTVYFSQDKAPPILVPSESTPLREIEFPSPDDGMVMLRSCFVNHKVARYNRVTPPSILLRQAEDAARRQAEASRPSNPDDASPSGMASQDVQTGFSSSLKQSIQRNDNDSTASDARSEDEDDAMSTDDTPPAFDDDASIAGSTSSGPDLNALLDEEVKAPSLPPSAPLWAKAATNRRALLAQGGTESVEITTISYEVQRDQGTAQASGLTKANYYSPLWYDDLDQDHPQWHYDIDIRRSESEEASLECSPVHANSAGYVNMVTPVTIVYDVETMTRVELFTYINSFLEELGSRPALDQLATVEANPGIMLKAISSQAGLDNLAVNRAMCRLLAYAPKGKSEERKSCLKLLQAKGTCTSMLKRIMKHATLVSPDSEQALMLLSAWDVVLHIMAPTVYHDPVKLQVLTDENPQFLTSLTIPLLTDHTLWLLGYSPFARDLLKYAGVPDFLKNLIRNIQAIKPSKTGELTPRLHF